MGQRVLLEGFASGLLAGIAIKTGLALDTGKVTLGILEPVCAGAQAADCWRILIVVGVLSALFSILAIIEVISLSNDFRIGFLIYQAGFLLGLVPAFIFS